MASDRLNLLREDTQGTLQLQALLVAHVEVVLEVEGGAVAFGGSVGRLLVVVAGPLVGHASRVDSD